MDLPFCILLYIIILAIIYVGIIALVSYWYSKKVQQAVLMPYEIVRFLALSLAIMKMLDVPWLTLLGNDEPWEGRA